MNVKPDFGEGRILRIGQIRYLNVQPIFHYFQRVSTCADFTFVSGVPSMLNKMLRDGTIDISPSSSIEYLRNPEIYRMLDSHSISSAGPVKSILLFSKVLIDDLDGKDVLTSSQSETSVVLLKIILMKFYNISCRLTSTSISFDKGLQSHDAYLLIGDDALEEARKQSDLKIYDLGQLWHQFTGLPFVYAIWVANKHCCMEKGELLANFQKKLDCAKSYFMDNLSQLAESIHGESFFSKDDMITYWQGISYDFSEMHQKGLECFRKYALEIGSI